MSTTKKLTQHYFFIKMSPTSIFCQLSKAILAQVLYYKFSL